MKSANDWLLEFKVEDDKGLIEYIRAIQSDALKAAAGKLKKCDCSKDESSVCQFGRLNACNPPAYWQIMSLLPEE